MKEGKSVLAPDEESIVQMFGHPPDGEFDNERLARRVLEFPNTDGNWYVASAVTLAGACLETMAERDEARARLAAMLDAFGGYNTPDVDAAIAHMQDVGLDVWSMQRVMDIQAPLRADIKALSEALIQAKREMWIGARDGWTLEDFKNWAVIQQIDAALAAATSTQPKGK